VLYAKREISLRRECKGELGWGWGLVAGVVAV
jgi:hypothetical protein